MQAIERPRVARPALRSLITAAALVGLSFQGLVGPQAAQAAVSGGWAGGECMTSLFRTDFKLMDGVYSTRPGDVWWTRYQILIEPNDYRIGYSPGFTSGWVKGTTTHAGWNMRRVETHPAPVGYNYKLKVWQWIGGREYQRTAVYYSTRYGSTAGPFRGWCSIV